MALKPPYQKTVWKNREVERPRTYILQDNGDGTHTLVPAEGAIIEPGTPITAQNMNNIEDGIEVLDNTLKSHLAESAQKHITESGSNSNGRYIKFDDGTMICTGKIVEQSLQFTAHATGLWRTDFINFAYPQSFVGAYPALSISSTSAGNFGIWMNSASRSLTQGSYRAFAMGDQSGNAIGDMYFIAIGRWK